MPIVSQEEMVNRELEIEVGNSRESSGLQYTLGFFSTQIIFKTTRLNGTI